MLPIAIDAMGGDHAPEAIIEGAVRAHRDDNIPVVLVGQPEALGGAHGLDVVHASEVIDMCEEPGVAVRKKKDSSLVVAAELVRDRKASAMVSAGNTGATMASALLRMGRVSGASRPAIATTIPVPGSTPTILADSGANADCQPEWLVQFARMATVYSRTRFGVARPRVAVLSIGEEAGKGNELAKRTHELLKDATDLHFIGNVEGRDFLRPVADVVVTDGFTGNIVLKTLEGGVGYLASRVKDAFGMNPLTKLAGGIMAPKLRSLMGELDPEGYGGAMLLGLKGVCIISHGSSTPTAMVNAIRVARDMVEGNVVSNVQSALAASSSE